MLEVKKTSLRCKKSGFFLQFWLKKLLSYLFFFEKKQKVSSFLFRWPFFFTTTRPSLPKEGTFPLQTSPRHRGRLN